MKLYEIRLQRDCIFIRRWAEKISIISVSIIFLINIITNPIHSFNFFLNNNIKVVFEQAEIHFLNSHSFFHTASDFLTNWYWSDRIYILSKYYASDKEISMSQMNGDLQSDFFSRESSGVIFLSEKIFNSNPRTNATGWENEKFCTSWNTP